IFAAIQAQYHLEVLLANLSLEVEFDPGQLRQGQHSRFTVRFNARQVVENRIELLKLGFLSFVADSCSCVFRSKADQISLNPFVESFGLQADQLQPNHVWNVDVLQYRRGMEAQCIDCPDDMSWCQQCPPPFGIDDVSEPLHQGP